MVFPPSKVSCRKDFKIPVSQNFLTLTSRFSLSISSTMVEEALTQTEENDV